MSELKERFLKAMKRSTYTGDYFEQYADATVEFIESLLQEQKNALDRANHMIGDMADETKKLLKEQRKEFVERLKKTRDKCVSSWWVRDHLNKYIKEIEEYSLEEGKE